MCGPLTEISLIKIMIIRTTGVHGLTTLIQHNYFDFQTQPQSADGQVSLRDIQALIRLDLVKHLMIENKCK